MFRSRLTRHVIAAAAAAVSILLFASASQADGACRSVEGHYREQDAGGPTCSSPVGLCITGQYRGDIKGSFAGQASAILPTADTPTTGVILFTSDSIIQARIAFILMESLLCRSSAAIRR